MYLPGAPCLTTTVIRNVTTTAPTTCSRMDTLTGFPCAIGRTTSTAFGDPPLRRCSRPWSSVLMISRVILVVAVVVFFLPLRGSPSHAAPPKMQVDGQPYFPIGWFSNEPVSESDIDPLL